MKRFWHTCLAMIASATVTAGVADAQNNWNAPSEIGSYQSILSRAGYGQESTMATALPGGGGSGTTNLPMGNMGGGSGSTFLWVTWAAAVVQTIFLRVTWAAECRSVVHPAACQPTVFR